MNRFVTHTLILILSLISVNAWAADANRLTSVDFSATGDYLEFSFQADQPVAESRLSARADGNVLVFRFDELVAKRRWIKIRDKQVKRTLVHPSREMDKVSYFRVRFFEPVTDEVVRNIRVRQDGNRLIAAVPRSTAIAVSWENANVVARPEANKAAAPVGPEFVPTAPTTDMPQPTESITSAEDLPLFPEKTSGETAPAKDAASGEDTEMEAGLAQMPEDTLNFGAVAMSLLFLAVVGVFLWRKMRAPQANENGGPMIRPVGSHMLGPKQGLLLIEVAGDMVLLGTGDKGVQMLTKIESKPSPDAQSVASRVESLEVPISEEALRQATRPGLAERFGSALERIREVTGTQNIRAESYSSIQDDVESPSNEGDHLSQLIAGVEDVRLSRASRREFDPVQPAKPEPIYQSQPPVNDGDDLLQRLRNLQSA